MLWQLGASCAEDTSGSTTHVVAGTEGTDKVHWARKHGKHVVSEAWLLQCGARPALLSVVHRAPERPGH